MKTEAQVERAIAKYGDMVARICVLYLKDHADSEDIFQTVFLRYFQKAPPFDSDEHEKAWLLRVAINGCKDVLKSPWRQRITSDEVLAELPAPVREEQGELLEVVLSLPKKYKEVLYLHYYEDYPAQEIALILKKNINTVYTLLSRGRELLKQQIGGESGEKRMESRL